MKKKVMILIVVVLGAIQLIPHEFDMPETDPTMVFKTDNVEVHNILNKACMDCHSNQTEYPWYASITPVNYWLAGHIKEGREHLNFSEWNTYPAADQRHVAKEIVEVIEKKEMPMLFYWLIHWDAKLTPEERQTLVDYFNAIK